MSHPRLLALCSAFALIGTAMAAPALDVNAVVRDLVAQHGEAERPRIEKGLTQVASLWQPSDGDLPAFAKEAYIADKSQLAATLSRIEGQLEQLDGYALSAGRELRTPVDLDSGPLLPVDNLFAAMNPGAHLTDDLFEAKVGFAVLLNVPIRSLAEQVKAGATLSRDDMAWGRLAERFARRVPASVYQAQSKASADADLYISTYNLWMHHVLTEKGERLFPSGMRLISHWNLRDELKADYSEKDGVRKQRVLAKAMERIVTQQIPRVVIDNPRVDWDPFANTVVAAPSDTVEKDAPASTLPVSNDAEPDTRYAWWIAQFQAAKLADPYSPLTPTAIARSFEIDRRIPEDRVRQILTDVLTAPVIKKVATKIKKDLKSSSQRGLEPFDVWYTGFRPRAAFTEADLDAITRKKYPTAKAFADDIPRILVDLGFSQDKARFLADHIVVDAARGAGHAMEARRRGDLPHLRTRVGKDGMDYKGYNIAIHELGHNVEQVISLYEVDHTLLAGVPNSAFTEAFAFTFQARDLELLGLQKPDTKSRRLETLDKLWSTYEIAGVALVDLDAWHWLYDHPNATPAEFRVAVVDLAKRTWNQYYAPVLGSPDNPNLAIYSHIVAYPLYVADYPLGHLISEQIGAQFEKSPNFGAEFERMAKQGSILPDLWMQGATGQPLSAKPLLEAAEKALKE